MKYNERNETNDNIEYFMHCMTMAKARKNKRI